MTVSEEKHLICIYRLSKATKMPIATNAIADKLEIAAASVTSMINKLAKRELITYRAYKGVLLTAKGRTMAQSLIRKFYLWEVFLVKHLKFTQNEAYTIAQELQHTRSNLLIDRLEQHLNYPKQGPFGDLIPTKDGQFKSLEIKLLSEVDVGSKGTLIKIKESSIAFLNFLNKNRIVLGDCICLLEREEFDASLHIKIRERTLHISNQIAKNLYIEL